VVRGRYKRTGPIVTNGHRKRRSWIIFSETIVAKTGTIKNDIVKIMLCGDLDYT
jgi:hypothetical protein